MTESQKKWTEHKQKELDEFIQSNIPLTDEQWQQVVDWIGKTVDQAKGSKDDCRAEVRQALFDILEKHDRERKRNVSTKEKD